MICSPCVGLTLHELVQNFHRNIAAITNETEATEPYPCFMLRQGVERAALELGYKLVVHRVRVGNRRSNSLQHLLISENVVGVILLPIDRCTRLNNYLPWEMFSVVSLAHKIATPIFDTVRPDDFDAATQIFHQSIEAGYQTVAYVSHPGLKDLHWDNLQNAARAFNSEHGTQLKFVSAVEDDVANLAVWLESVHADVILVDNDQEADHVRVILGEAIAENTPFFVLDHIGMPNTAGIDRRHDIVGETAVLHLHHLISTGSTGIPSTPNRRYVRGQWVNASSIRHFVNGYSRESP